MLKEQLRHQLHRTRTNITYHQYYKRCDYAASAQKDLRCSHILRIRRKMTVEEGRRRRLAVGRTSSHKREDSRKLGKVLHVALVSGPVVLRPLPIYTISSCTLFRFQFNVFLLTAF